MNGIKTWITPDRAESAAGLGLMRQMGTGETSDTRIRCDWAGMNGDRETMR